MSEKTKRELLYIDGITVDFDGFKALNSLSFIIYYRTMQAIVGPNGAGKTTFMDIITGRTRPSTGRLIYKESINLLKYDEAAIVGLGIARKFQRPSVFPDQSVLENLKLAAFKRKNIINSFFYNQKNLDNEFLMYVIEQIGLDDFVYQKAGLLSHGQKQWLEIGMLLAQEAELLMLDEPVAGMNDEERARTSELLKVISKEKTIIVIEHDMDFVESLNCPVTVLNEGMVLAEGTMDVLKKNKEVIDVYLGR